jgi:hypothetical protein
LIKTGPGKHYEKAQLNQPLYSADLVKTLHDSEVEITFHDNIKIFLTEDSELQLHRSMIREKDYTSIGLLFGKIKAIVGKLSPERSEFSINTVTITAGIRGTSFEVAVREDGAVLVAVEEGEVEMKYGKESYIIPQGNASSFLITGEKKDYTVPPDYKAWSAEALEKFKENPEQFFKRLLERERLIIERLKDERTKLESYKEEWDVFIRHVDFSHRHGRYEEELELIEKQIERTKRIMIHLSVTRRNLAIIRSIFVLTARIEQQISPEVAKKLPSLQELKKEFVKASVVIRRIDEAEHKLRKVLYILNRRYDEIKKMAE